MHRDSTRGAARGRLGQGVQAQDQRGGQNGWQVAVRVPLQPNRGLWTEVNSPKASRVLCCEAISRVDRRSGYPGNPCVGSRPLLSLFGRGVAQSGSAPALGAGSRRFKSSRPDQSLAAARSPGRKLLSPPGAALPPVASLISSRCMLDCALAKPDARPSLPRSRIRWLARRQSHLLKQAASRGGKLRSNKRRSRDRVAT